MIKAIIYKSAWMGALLFLLSACAPDLVQKSSGLQVPDGYGILSDTANSAAIDWKAYFKDPNLIALIDTALKSNQELRIFLQEIQVEQNEVQVLKGEYLPFVSAGLGLEVDKVGRYTRNGVVEASHEIKPGREFPEPLSNLTFGLQAQWEIDAWSKLRTARKAAANRYLASVEGRNLLVTNLVAEIANEYYELLALDNQLILVKQNVALQRNALELVRLQKQSARVTELAVKRFEAQLLDTKSLQYIIQQRITEAENRINFLLGRFPQRVERDANGFNTLAHDSIQAGIPAQLLSRRPDIRQAELQLAAAKLDVRSARARFYPSLDIEAGLGFEAFDPKYLITTPESLVYSAAGGLVAPLVNRRAIKAAYGNATARQEQAVYHYERTILNAYIEVMNQLSNLSNMQVSYVMKEQQVTSLAQAVEISNNLFKSARADYIEVLLTQEEALDSKLELIETKTKQIQSWVSLYRALGGGWE